MQIRSRDMIRIWENTVKLQLLSILPFYLVTAAYIFVTIML